MTINKRDRVPSYYQEEDLLRYWGKTTPNRKERAEMFEKWWYEWQPNRLNLREVIGFPDKTDINGIRKHYGHCNVVVRGSEARFRNNEDALACFFLFYEKERVDEYDETMKNLGV